jgi:opacity protein-like surface antigen
MISLRASLLGLALLAGSTISAMAADLGNLRGDDDATGTGAARFYIRGDLGYEWNSKPSVSQLGQDLTETSMANDWNYGGGFGYYFSPNWRIDLTAEHHNGAVISGNYAAVGTLTGGSENFNVTSDVILANLYYDFTGRAGFNPYLGVGLGWAANHTMSGSATDACGCTTTIDSATESHLAWALMAGVTKDLDRGFSVDVGYRLLDVGGTHTGNVINKLGNAIDGSSVTTGAIYSNEIRVGLRYDIN